MVLDARIYTFALFSVEIASSLCFLIIRLERRLPQHVLQREPVAAVRVPAGEEKYKSFCQAIALI